MFSRFLSHKSSSSSVSSPFVQYARRWATSASSSSASTGKSSRAMATTQTAMKSKQELDLQDFVRQAMKNGQKGGSAAGGIPAKKGTQVEFAGVSVKIPGEYELYTKSRIPQLVEEKVGKSRQPVSSDYVNQLIAASCVFPMRTNNYVCDELIDWSKRTEDGAIDDDLFRLTFPQPEMLNADVLQHLVGLVKEHGTTSREGVAILREEAERVRAGMNPHPAKQKELNVPDEMQGVQHKYRETILFFPMEAQYCHAFCTYCFRWAQFTAVGSDQVFSGKNAEALHAYLKKHKCITDLLFTGGDPMVMTAKQFTRYVDPIVSNSDGSLDHVSTIRIGTKSLAYWPYRFLTEPDADEILRMFERVVASGRQLSIMAHFTHWKELTTPAVQAAIRRIRMTGANIRTQSPLVRHVNDSAETWARKWALETRLGCVPYYMFVERDTGARHYFEVPLARGVEIYRKAISLQSGLARTVRGPSMSMDAGKAHVLGVIDVPGKGKAFVMQFLAGRNPDWTFRPFLAKYDEKATWFHDLKPLEGDKFFFEDEFAQMEVIAETEGRSSGQLHPHPHKLYEGIIAPGLTEDMHDEMDRLALARTQFVPRAKPKQGRA